MPCVRACVRACACVRARVYVLSCRGRIADGSFARAQGPAQADVLFRGGEEDRFSGARAGAVSVRGFSPTRPSPSFTFVVCVSRSLTVRCGAQAVQDAHLDGVAAGPRVRPAIKTARYATPARARACAGSRSDATGLRRPSALRFHLLWFCHLVSVSFAPAVLRHFTHLHAATTPATFAPPPPPPPPPHLPPPHLPRPPTLPRPRCQSAH